MFKSNCVYYRGLLMKRFLISITARKFAQEMVKDKGWDPALITILVDFGYAKP